MQDFSHQQYDRDLISRRQCQDIQRFSMVHNICQWIPSRYSLEVQVDHLKKQVFTNDYFVSTGHSNHPKLESGNYYLHSRIDFQGFQIHTLLPWFCCCCCCCCCCVQSCGSGSPTEASASFGPDHSVNKNVATVSGFRTFFWSFSIQSTYKVWAPDLAYKRIYNICKWPCKLGYL